MMLAAIVASIAVLFVALLPLFMRRRRTSRYSELLAECIERQPDHEREHIEAHGGHFTNALRIESIARRFQRKIDAAGLPPLPPDDLRARAREALWPRG